MPRVLSCISAETRFCWAERLSQNTSGCGVRLQGQYALCICCPTRVVNTHLRGRTWSCLACKCLRCSLSMSLAISTVCTLTLTSSASRFRSAITTWSGSSQGCLFFSLSGLGLQQTTHALSCFVNVWSGAGYMHKRDCCPVQPHNRFLKRKPALHIDSATIWNCMCSSHKQARSCDLVN